MFKKYIKPSASIIKYLFNNHRKKIPVDEKKNLNNQEKNLLNQLKKNGYAVIKNFLSEENCKAIIEILDNVIEKYPNKIWRDEHDSDNRIFGAEIIDQKIMKYFNDDLIYRVGETYCDCKIKNQMVMANRVNFSSKNKGSGSGWHKDAYRRQFKSLLYLHKVNKSNGPFQLIKGSNKFFNSFRVATKLQKTYRDTRFTNEEVLSISKENDIETLEGDVGTLILFDPTLIHRGAPLESFKRYALTNYYESLRNFDTSINHYQPRFNFN